MSQMPAPTPLSSKNAFALASVVAASIALVGGLLIASGKSAAQYGVTMFMVLPVATGLVTACFVRPLSAAMLTVVISLLLCFVALLFLGLEGIVCIIMAAPLILVGALLGALIGAGLCLLARKYWGQRSSLLVLPILATSSVFGGGQVENSLEATARVEEVATTRILEAGINEVWAALVTVDEVSAKKPLLLQIGLPVPRNCTLDRPGVGGRRICSCDSGIIEEEVTAWDPPHRIEMRIIRSTLPGRHWLRFRSASYTIEPITPQTTRATRTTTISSVLRPTWYWRFFEACGVESEHRYLFDSVSETLKRQAARE